MHHHDWRPFDVFEESSVHISHRLPQYAMNLFQFYFNIKISHELFLIISIVKLIFSFNSFTDRCLQSMSKIYASLISALPVTALLFLLLNLALHSPVLIRLANPTVEETEPIHLRLNSTSSALLSAVKEDVAEVRTRVDPDPEPVRAPINSTKEERIKWFMANIESFKILKQTNLSKQFNNRVKKFFNGVCKDKFYMTWIAPATLFGRRELVAVESLFHSHPNGCLLILSAELDSDDGKHLFKPFTELGYKVMAVSPDFPYLARGTPAAKWYDELLTGGVDPGEVPLPQNLSNLLRLLVLHRYGGVYLDADVVVVKSLSGLKNAVGAQAADEAGKWVRLNNAVLVFDAGHRVLHEFIHEFAASFNGSRWGHNGPYLMTRVLRRTAGHGVSVMPPAAFYPVDWTRIGGLFRRPNSLPEARWVTAKVAQLAGGGSYTVHLWNKESRRLKIEDGSVMSHIIKSCCILCKNSNFSSLLYSHI